MKTLKPKGTLIAIGGGEDSEEFLKRVVKETGKQRPRICYMTIATISQKEAALKHKKFFKDMGMSDVSIIHFETRAEADLPKNIENIKNCHAVFIGGGDQLRLSSLLGGTYLLAEIKKNIKMIPRLLFAGTVPEQQPCQIP